MNRLLITTFLIIAAGLFVVVVYDARPQPGSRHVVQTAAPVKITEAICLKKGGLWQRWGKYPDEFCQVPAHDAGVSCKDSMHCSTGTCMASGMATRGKCAIYKQEVGCYYRIEEGKPAQKICAQ